MYVPRWQGGRGGCGWDIPVERQKWSALGQGFLTREYIDDSAEPAEEIVGNEY
jgi:hypothetical protein